MDLDLHDWERLILKEFALRQTGSAAMPVMWECEQMWFADNTVSACRTMFLTNRAIELLGMEAFFTLMYDYPDELPQMDYGEGPYRLSECSFPQTSKSPWAISPRLFNKFCLRYCSSVCKPHAEKWTRQVFKVPLANCIQNRIQTGRKIMMRIRYEEMYPSEVTAMMRNKPLAVIPLGLLEWHGEHLPLGQDGLKALGLCEMLVHKLGYGLVLPVFWWCRPGFSTFEGTLTFSASAVEQMLYELLGQMQKIGAKVVLMLTGHYGGCQVDAVKRVADTYMRENPGMTVIAGPEYEGVMVDGEEPADHAGKWETSLFSYFYPELARMGAFKVGTETVRQYQNPPHDYYHENPVCQWRDDLADLAVASPERGRRAAEAIVEVWAERVESALERLVAAP